MTIRLGSIARHLPLETRLAVADAVAYDAPASGDSTDRPPGGNTPQATSSQPVPGVSSPHGQSAEGLPGGSSPQAWLGQSPPGVVSLQGGAGGGSHGGSLSPLASHSSLDVASQRLASQRVSWAASNQAALDATQGEHAVPDLPTQLKLRLTC